MENLKHDYKGYTIELTPQGSYCSAFAAGKTEERALSRSRELIDFEEAYRARP